MLVDKIICDAWEKLYKYQVNAEPIIRYGTRWADGETGVELYLQRVEFVVFPNKSLFKFTCPRTTYISRRASVQDLEKKINRVLNAYLYLELKNKSQMVTKARLWKSLTNNLE